MEQKGGKRGRSTEEARRRSKGMRPREARHIHREGGVRSRPRAVKKFSVGPG